MPIPNLRDRISRFADLQKLDEHGEIVAAHPPAWLVAGVEARGAWAGIRPLVACSEIPVVRPDGTLWQTQGYDAVTGILHEPGVPTAPLPEHPTIDDAWAALELLGEIVIDFRFVGEAHRSAWGAGLLTLVARHAFDGPAPLFLFDANVRGAGKGLLADIIGLVANGRPMPVSTYCHDTEEMRKRITAIALAADSVVLLDNIDGRFGNDALDAALTTTRWKDRILGRSELADVPLLTVWFGTGNNVQVAADTARRLVYSRLDVLEERPEHRSAFRHPNLRAWVLENRARLLAAAITVVAAYLRAGRPDQRLTPMGSYEGWSGTIRSALVWAGWPDPCAARESIVESADSGHETIERLIAIWPIIDPQREGVVWSKTLAQLYPTPRDRTPHDADSVAARATLEAITGASPAKPPEAPGPRQAAGAHTR